MCVCDYYHSKTFYIIEKHVKYLCFAKSYNNKNMHSLLTSECSFYSSNSSSLSKCSSATQLNKYIIGKTIGQGTFGRVKLAIHEKTNEFVAIKILEKSKLTRSGDMQRTKTELRALHVLKHPHIIQLYEIIESKNEMYIVTEYASRGELFEYILEKQRISEREASVFMKQILSAVTYMHMNHVAHRDLKPENLLLDEFGHIKVVDFGLSKIYKGKTFLNTACGSPCYAAPEMIEGKKYIPLAVDLWSCGIVLYALICGFLPFEDSNTNTLYTKIVTGKYQCPSWISKEAKHLLERLLEVDPSKRITLNELFKHPWMNQPEVVIPRSLKDKTKEKKIIYECGVMTCRKCNQLGQKDNLYCNKVIEKKLNAMGYDIQNVQNYISKNKRNHITTVYYLLLVKYHRDREATNGSCKRYYPEFSQSFLKAFLSAASKLSVLQKK